MRKLLVILERGSPAYATGFEAFDLSEVGPQ